MKKLLTVIALAALGGCATQYPATYANRAAYNQPDANGWQVVSVTPVAPGTGAQAAASGQAGRVTTEAIATYSPAPVAYVAQPVYVPTPVYAAPAYDPFWYPPVSIGLGFSWGHWGGHRGYVGGRMRGHR